MRCPSSDPRASRQRDGLTRMDVLFALAGLLLAGCVLWPAMAAVGPEAARSACAKNLKQLGAAYRAWAQDHGNRMPWRLSAKDGGLFDLPGNGNVWVQQAWLSNHLESPKLLACPADKVTPASSWTRQEDGGLLHPRFRGNAVSYFVGVDGWEDAPRAFLAGDGNVQPSASAQACDQANVKTAASLAPGKEAVQWTRAVHDGQGNILQYDGAVVETSSASLRALLPDTGAIHVDNHVLLPR